MNVTQDKRRKWALNPAKRRKILSHVEMPLDVDLDDDRDRDGDEFVYVGELDRGGYWKKIEEKNGNSTVSEGEKENQNGMYNTNKNDSKNNNKTIVRTRTIILKARKTTRIITRTKKTSRTVWNSSKPRSVMSMSTTT